jgi:hypothetical protein
MRSAIFLPMASRAATLPYCWPRIIDVRLPPAKLCYDALVQTCLIGAHGQAKCSNRDSLAGRGFAVEARRLIHARA